MNEKVEGRELLIAKDFWIDLIQSHPEITKVSFVRYPVQPHGEGEFYSKEIRFVLLSKYPENDDLFPDTNLSRVPELVAINSIVDVCNVEGCKHTFDDHLGHYGYFLECYYDDIYPSFINPYSFIFIDFESQYERLPERVLSALSKVEENVYVLVSGGSYHGIIDKLVKPEELPFYTGKMVCMLAEEFKSRNLLGYGDDLMKNGHDLNKLKNWCDDVIDKVGHIDGDREKEVYVIDLRFVAHSMQRLIQFLNYLNNPKLKERPDIYSKYEYGAFYLRVSHRLGKYDLPPMLVAQKTGNTTKIFSHKLNKHQSSLF